MVIFTGMALVALSPLARGQTGSQVTKNRWGIFDTTKVKGVKVNGAYILSGTGTPEGVVTGNVGDMFIRTDGSGPTTFYRKGSGNGTNTGWVDEAGSAVPTTRTITINGTTQDLSADRTYLATSATPQFARMGLGLAADPNVLLYLQNTGSLSDNIFRINSGATPAYSQMKITANGLGSLSWLNYAADNIGYGFDVDWSAAGWVARHAACGWLYKLSSKLSVYGSTGNTIGAAATFTPLTTWDLSNGFIGFLTQTPTNIISMSGQAARTIWMERHTTSNTAGNNLNIQAGGATVGATDKSGGSLNLVSGTATGTGSSAITLQTATAQGSTSTTDNAPTTKMTILGSGNVGIGVTAPTALLDIEATAAAAEIIMNRFETSTSAPRLRMRHARGTQGAPTTIANADGIGGEVYQGYDGAAYQNGAAIIAEADAAVSSGIVPGRILFQTATTAGTLTTGITLNNAQNLTLAKNIISSNGIANEGIVTVQVDTIMRGNESTSRASFAVANSAVAGFYIVEYYIACTTALSATPTVTMTINWDNATKSTVSPAINLGALTQRQFQSVPIYHTAAAGSSIRVLTTLTGSVTTERWMINLTVHRRY